MPPPVQSENIHLIHGLIILDFAKKASHSYNLHILLNISDDFLLAHTLKYVSSLEIFTLTLC